MNTWWGEVLTVLCSSGLVGLAITALAKRGAIVREANIRNIVQELNQNIYTNIAEVKDTQMQTVDIMQNMITEIAGLKKTQKELMKETKKTQKQIAEVRKESNDMDLLLIKALREHKIINGESDEMFKYLIERSTENGGEEWKEED